MAATKTKDGIKVNLSVGVSQAILAKVAAGNITEDQIPKAIERELEGAFQDVQHKLVQEIKAAAKEFTIPGEEELPFEEPEAEEELEGSATGEAIATGEALAEQPDDYDEWSLEDLYELSQEYEIKGRSNMSKSELAEAIRTYETADDAE